MSKIIAFLVVFLSLIYFLFLGIFYFEYDTKSKVLKEYADQVTATVKITGILTNARKSDFESKIKKLAEFSQTDSIKYTKANIDSSTGQISNISNYIVGEKLTRGQVFRVEIISSNIANYSRIINKGVHIDDSKNLYFKAVSVCYVEQVQE